jgi:Zn-dependent protease
MSELRMDAAGTKAPIQHLWSVLAINLGLLVFNLLPIYPLDGGEILSAVLWFVLRRAPQPESGCKRMASMGVSGSSAS